MLIEIDKTVLEQAQNGKELAIDLLIAGSVAILKSNHIIIAKPKVLSGIIQLKKLGKQVTEKYKNILNVIRFRKEYYDSIKFKAIVTLDSKVKTERKGNIIYINPHDKIFKQNSFSFEKTALLGENLKDCDMFEYIAQWYLHSQHKPNWLKYNMDKEPGGGSQICESYKNFAENKKDHFCICIADSDIKVDVDLMVKKGFIKKGQEPAFGNTFGNVYNYHRQNNPFNCDCYCFNKVMEIENLIPFDIIENDKTNKDNITDVLKNIDRSFFDFKNGLKKDALNKDENLHNYWYEILDKYPSVLNKDIIIKGLGENLLSKTLDNNKTKLSNIEDNQLSQSQKYEYEQIGERIIDWCCSIKYKQKL